MYKGYMFNLYPSLFMLCFFFFGGWDLFYSFGTFEVKLFLFSLYGLISLSAQPGNVSNGTFDLVAGFRLCTRLQTDFHLQTSEVVRIKKKTPNNSL